MAETIISQLDRAFANPLETNRQVNFISDRDAISALRRWEGMQVYVKSELTTYELRGGILNEHWTDISGVDSANYTPTGGYAGTAQDIVNSIASVTGGYENISVTWVANLDYYVVANPYLINGESFTASPTLVTLTVGDATNPRIDVIYADVNGIIGVLPGTPSASPIKEVVNSNTQREITFRLVPTLATVDPTATNELIFDENVGLAGGEWDVTGYALTALNFNATAVAFSGTKSIYFDGINPYFNVDFHSDVTFNIADISTVYARIYLTEVIDKNAGITFQLLDSAFVATGNAITVKHGLYGLDRNVLNTWQLISVPIGAFGATALTIKGFRFLVTSIKKPKFYLDTINLQFGVTQPPQITVDNYTIGSSGTEKVSLYKNGVLGTEVDLKTVLNTVALTPITTANKLVTEDSIASRVLATILTGISFITNRAVTAADSLLVAIGLLQKQITDLITFTALDASAFNKNLATTDNTVQKVANKVDGLILGGEATAPAVSETYVDIAAMLAAQGAQILNAFYKVDDASADPTITAGKAVYQYLGTTLGTLADYDLIWKLDSGVVSGSTLPTTGLDTGLFYRVDKVNRHILMQYNGTGWNPVRSFGEMTIWVSTTGTDNVNYGDGTGVNAFRTIAFAIEQIPPQYYGDVFVIVQAGTYNEEIYVSGKNAVGDFKIKIEGEYTSVTGSFTSIARDTTLGRFKPSDSTKAWTVNEHEYKFLHITSGINVGCMLPIISNTATELTCSYEVRGYRKDQYFVDTNNTFGVSSTGDTYEIVTPTTLINGHIFSKKELVNCQIMKFTSSSIAKNIGEVFLGAVQLYVNGDTNSRFQTVENTVFKLNGCSLWSISTSTCWAILQALTAYCELQCCYIRSVNTFANGGVLFWNSSVFFMFGTTILGKVEMAINTSGSFGWNSGTASNITALNVYSSSVGQRLNTAYTLVGTKIVDAATYAVQTTS